VKRKTYRDSVTNILEREMKVERFRSPHLGRTDNQKLILEMEKIAQKISQENTISFAAINEIFKDSEKGSQLFSLLRFEESDNLCTEEIPQKKKRLKR